MKRTVEYSLCDPTGNLTLLVESPVPAAYRPAAAAQLMEVEPAAEQAGFLAADGSALSMAGGEFCGNAAMSAAALPALRGGAGGAARLRVSGAETPVPVAVEKLPDGSCRCAVSMPRPLSVGRENLPDGRPYPLVRFPGIVHVVLTDGPDRAWAEAQAPRWCKALGADALGLMLFDAAAGVLAPLVYVPAAGTLVWESSCASGTTAVGAYLAAESGGPLVLSLRQPGGMLSIEAGSDGALTLTGTVRLLRRGRAEINI